MAVRSGAQLQIGMPSRPLTAVRPDQEWIEHRPQRGSRSRRRRALPSSPASVYGVSAVQCAKALTAFAGLPRAGLEDIALPSTESPLTSKLIRVFGAPLLKLAHGRAPRSYSLQLVNRHQLLYDFGCLGQCRWIGDFWSPGSERRLGRIFKAQLGHATDRLSRNVTNHSQTEINARRHTSAGCTVSINYVSSIGGDSAEQAKMVSRVPVRSRLISLEQASRA